MPCTVGKYNKYTFVPFCSRQLIQAVSLQGAQMGIRSAVVRLPLYVFDKTGAEFSRLQEYQAVENKYASYVDVGAHLQACSALTLSIMLGEQIADTR